MVIYKTGKMVCMKSDSEWDDVDLDEEMDNLDLESHWEEEDEDIQL